MKTPRELMEIKEGFKKIKAAREWSTKYADTKPEDFAILLDKLEVLYSQLEKLGVDPSFSAALFIFEFKFDSILVNQFTS